MRDYRAHEIRNIAVLGHSGSGKSTVMEAMMVFTGALEKVEVNGPSELDFDREELRRKQTIYTKLVPIEWKDCKLNFIDTPGYLDFFGETQSGLAMADNALIVVSAKEGVESTTEKVVELAEERKLPTLFFINKMDEENASFERTYESLRAAFGKTVIAFEIPILDGDQVVGSVNVLRKKAWYSKDRAQAQAVPEHLIEQMESCYEQIREAIALSDEALMEKFFEGQDYTEDEFMRGIQFGVRNGELKPVYCGSAVELTGIERLLDLIKEYFPSYEEKCTIKAFEPDGSAVVLQTNEDEVMSAQVFKTVVDPFVGRISYLKVLTGILSNDGQVYNVNQDKTEKITQLFSIRGKYQLGVGKLFTGDIGAVVKLQYTQTSDTLTLKDQNFRYPPIALPIPQLGTAIWPVSKADEDKMSQAIQKIMEEDHSARFEKNTETNEFILYGLGEQHLDVLLNRLKNKYKVEVSTTQPKVPYRETIRKTVEAEGRHKKQTGGAGQFGHVFIRFEPTDSEDLVFETKVVGGSVPKQYFPAVEVGLQECMKKGLLAGYRVVGVKATLYDGKYHDVDSKEIAFKAAARLAFKAGIPQANPVILEPIVRLEVTVADRYTGAVIGDLNKRRGIILGMSGEGDRNQIISAEVPMSEVMSYATDLRSLTQGSGSYEQIFDRYDPAPENVAKKVIESAEVETSED